MLVSIPGFYGTVMEPSRLRPSILQHHITKLLPSLLSASSISNTPKTPPLLTIRATTTNPSRRRCSLDVEMVPNSDGVWAAEQKKVVVLWDLDNKPPRGPPYQAAMALRHVAQHFGDVVDISAYANRHAFIHLPQWVVEQRRERKQMDILERKGMETLPGNATTPHVCGVCGRKCKTNMDLKRHFKQLHERERQKKLSRMRSLKGKKQQRYKQRFITGNHKYEDAARVLLTPKVGYGLASELRRAGVFVKTVEDKPQAADSALKRQMQHSMSRGIDCLVLVSDDSDYTEMLRRARDSNLQTVVVGDGRRALGRHADFWVSWFGVENGEVGEEILKGNSGFEDEDWGLNDTEKTVGWWDFDDDDNDDDGDIEDHLVEHIAVMSEGLNSGFNKIRISAFSEDDDLYWDSQEE